MKAFISCIICVVFCTEGVFSACPVGSTANSGHCFIASLQTVKYQHAQMYCLGYGCKVAVPSASLKSALQSFGNANSLSNVWCGLLDAMSEGTFVEAPLGTEFTDTVWASGKPSVSTNSNCVRISSLSTWEMTDVSCTGKNNFICDCGPES